MTTAAGSKNGKSAADAEDVKEHLRAAGEAAADAARAKAERARDWAQERWSGLQEQVEEQPFRATVWALGLGVAAGFILANLMRSRR